MRMKVFIAVLSAAFAMHARENLLRDDFISDNCGGFVGWAQSGYGGSFMPDLITGPNGTRALRLVATAPDKKAAVMYGPSGVFMFDTNETVRLSAKVRTRGLTGTHSMFRIYPQPWSHDLVVRIPEDTEGQWMDVAWEGKIPFCEPSGAFYVTVFASKTYPDGAYLDIASPRLEGTLRADRKSRLPRDETAGGLKPRVTPVDPVLGDMSAENARMRFYYPGPLSDRGEKCMLRATLGGKTVFAPFDARHFATAIFGRHKSGETSLKAEVVTKKTRRVLATSIYRATLNANINGVTPLKRINNFVSEIFSRRMSERRHEFTLAKRSWVFLGLDKPYPGVGVKVDGEEVIRHREGEPSETIRELSAGRHVIELTGLTEEARQGSLSARVVKVVIHESIDNSLVEKNNFDGMYYGSAFFRDLGLYRDFTHTSLDWPRNPGERWSKLAKEMEDRGVFSSYAIGMGARDPRRLDYEAFLCHITNAPAYKAGKPLLFDENSIAALIGGRAKIHATEAWWHAFGEGRRIDVLFEDGAHQLHANPLLDIPEISAYINSGIGRGLMVSEMYFSSPDTMNDVDRIMSFMRRQIRSLRGLVPSAPAHYIYLLNGWMMIGGWTTWSNPANDIRALYGEILRVLATDPEFADVGGAAVTKPKCPEDLYRFYSQAMRYYCIDGGMGDFAAQNGIKMFPRHLINGDFSEGFRGWNVSAADNESLVPASRKGFGLWQGRGYARWTRARNGLFPGDTFARFTRKANKPNTLRQKLVGLESGRVYQLTFVFCDEESVEKIMSSRTPRRVAKPLRIPHINARVLGVEPIHDLDHQMSNFGKYGKNVIFAKRLVFKATSSQAEVVFSDWEDPKNPGSDIGSKVMLNYIGCCLYFNQGTNEIETLKRIFRDGKERDKKGRSY